MPGVDGLLVVVLLAVAGWLWPDDLPPPASSPPPSGGSRWSRLRHRLGHRPAPVELTAEQAARCALLVAACLEAGATPAAALRQAAQADSGPEATRLAPVLLGAADELEAGAMSSPALSSGALRPIGAVFRRSMLSGSAMSRQLVDAAEQLRSETQFVRLERARRVGVLAALPLGACLLPAFVLLAVVPAVLGLTSAL